MYIYFLLIIFICAARFLLKDEKKMNLFVCIISFVLLSAVQGFRGYEIGTDTYNYVSFFMVRESDSIILEKDTFFLALTNAIAKFTSSRTVYLTIIAMIQNALIISSIYILSKEAFISIIAYVTLYYYCNSFNILREYLSISFALMGYALQFKKKLPLSILFYFAAVFIHGTGIIGIVLFVSYYLEEHISKKNVLTMAIAMCVCALFFTSYFRTFSWFLLSSSQYFDIYVDSELFMEYKGFRDIVVNAVILICYISIVNKPKYKFMSLCCLFVSIMTICGTGFIRVLYFFDIFNIFILDEIWTSLDPVKSRNMIRCALLIILVAFFFYLLSGNVMRVKDYTFAF